MKHSKQKKGAMGFEVLPAVVISIGIAVFALALIATFLGTLQDTQITEEVGCNSTGVVHALSGCNYAYNATTSGLEGLAEFNNWWSILIIGAVFLIIFGLLAVIRSRTSSI